ncbi:hypothetical protein GCM10027217_13020 [Pseudomaricurvus hydrocarbonicus]
MVEAPLLQTNVELWVNGMITTTVYRQTFHNLSTDWVEGRYLFPLPDRAAVNGMTMRIGERIIVGEIQEKLRARKLYQQAKTAGKKVSLVEQQRPNLFTQTVANVPPDEHIQVTLTYREVAHYEHGNFSLHLPLTITPRYIPGLPIRDAVDEPPETMMTEPPGAKAAPSAPTVSAMQINQHGWGQATDQVADAALITAPMSERPRLPNGTIQNPVSITVHLRAGLPLARIDSPYHDLVIRKHGDEHTITLSEGQVAMDRDFVLSWQPVKQKTLT